MGRLFVLLLLFVVMIEICTSLSCLPCNRKLCVKQEKKLKCVGNLVRDACGCCYVCAKQLNEYCGGLWNISGICDVGLMCQPFSFYGPLGICTRKGNNL